jgi:hypothetical protein
MRFVQVGDLFLSWDRGETPSVKGDLSFAAFVPGQLAKSGLNQFPDPGRGRNLKGNGLLIAEETALPATQMGKKHRDDEWSFNHISYPAQINSKLQFSKSK